MYTVLIMFFLMCLCALRHIGFKDWSECPELNKLEYEYLKEGKVCEEKIY